MIARTLRAWLAAMPRPSSATAVVASGALLGVSIAGLARSLTPQVPPVAIDAPVTDINRCEANELCLLPGVGPALAQRIISDRTQRGPFRSVDELDRVKGIGPTTLERIRPWISCSG